MSVYSSYSEKELINMARHTNTPDTGLMYELADRLEKLMEEDNTELLKALRDKLDYLLGCVSEVESAARSVDDALEDLEG